MQRVRQCQRLWRLAVSTLHPVVAQPLPTLLPSPIATPIGGIPLSFMSMFMLIYLIVCGIVLPGLRFKSSCVDPEEYI
jgi:hypothetical protein